MTGNLHGDALVWALLLGFAGVVTAPFFIIYVSQKDVDFQIRLARRVLIGGLAALVWLDAVVVILAIGVESGAWAIGYIVAAAALTYLFLRITPRKSRKTAILGTLAIWGWTAMLPSIPWNPSKRFAMDMRRISDQPLELAREIIADYEVDVFALRDPTEDEMGERTREKVASGKVRDLDLTGLEATSLQFDYLFGGSTIYLRNGKVDRVHFLYD